MSAPTEAQMLAADPGGSVWVTANAGTGKTRVLTDRVLRLLLAGANPEGILCLTFTKAAAAEMLQRIEQRLAGWVSADDAQLVGDLTDLTGSAPDTAMLARARRLFARVLDLPLGLGIMTIHALCGALLRRFPLEAGVAPHFETIDERGAAELLREAQAEVLRDGRDADSPLGQALELLAVTLADGGIAEALAEAAGDRIPLLAACSACGGIDGLIQAIHGALEADPGLTPGELERRACADGEFDAIGLLAAANALAGGMASDIERGQAIVAWLGSVPSDRLRNLASYRRCFLTAKGGAQKLATRNIAGDPAIQALVREHARLALLRSRLCGQTVAQRTAALLRVALAVIERYERLKVRQAVLDYDDLIERTNALLAQPGKTEWVLFKLDARIDHLLVDEAQDTSPAQWRIILRLTEEFFAGKGARDVQRTLFVVGDEKQSIYSFQGADLANFRRVRALLRSRAAAGGVPMREVVLDRSFRSVPTVLAVVDAVFVLPEARPGVIEGEDLLRHEAQRIELPGRVELWPLAVPAAAEGPVSAWPLPDEPRVADEPERRVARAIVRTIKGWLERGETLESTGQPIRPGDVLILLSRRGIAQERLIRALKQAGIPAAGADRLALLDSLPVRDLMALAQAVLLPEDDLNLACLLKSPLLGLSEEDLFDLAFGRGKASLIDQLRGAALREPERYGPASDRFAAWLGRADFLPPFEFFTWVLGTDGGRRRMLARLGPEAAEPIEGFLAQALAYERGHPASLQGFLHWLSLGTDQLKRDAEQAGDMVRVVTVHGAKGLEAPIVFLADAGPRQASRRGRLHWSVPELDGTPTALPFWRAPAGERPALGDGIDARETASELDERRRLLYVALTRARDRLYVTGWQPRRAPGEACWHALVEQALGQQADVTTLDGETACGLPGTLLRLCRGRSVPQPVIATSSAAPPPALPGWATGPAHPETPAERGRAPSRSEGESGGRSADAGANRRGLIVHKLLQLLPDLAPEERGGAAGRLIAAMALALPPDEAAALGREVLAILAQPEFAPVFGPGSRAEQAICGTVAGRSVVGQIDRLVVTPAEVLVVDLKSNRHPPGTPEATPRAYLAQLATYRALLRRLYPGRRVRAALLWTSAPRLDQLPDALLDRHAPEPP
ncbi:MAG: double-strand break repair helicase AddA [Geminicoccaceae bacterium]